MVVNAPVRSAEEFIVKFLGLLLDWIPYTVGRLALFVMTWGNVRCERWQPIVWSTDLFRQPWWRETSDEKISITSWGTRWIGTIVMILAVVGMFAGIFWMISKM